MQDLDREKQRVLSSNESQLQEEHKSKDTADGYSKLRDKLIDISQGDQENLQQFLNSLKDLSFMTEFNRQGKIVPKKDLPVSTPLKQQQSKLYNQQIQKQSSSQQSGSSTQRWNEGQRSSSNWEFEPKLNNLKKKLDRISAINISDYQNSVEESALLPHIEGKLNMGDGLTKLSSGKKLNGLNSGL